MNTVDPSLFSDAGIPLGLAETSAVCATLSGGIAGGWGWTPPPSSCL